MYKLVNPTNERAQAMWDIISPHCHWQLAVVADYGCGYGDLLSAANANGARLCYAIDTSHENFNYGCVMRNELGDDYVRVEVDFDYVIPEIKSDIAFFCSVLPYLENPGMVLDKIAMLSKLVFVECQYLGDGPGTILDDAEMAETLITYFRNIAPIGRTHVKGRDKYRTIWKCTNE